MSKHYKMTPGERATFAEGARRHAAAMGTLQGTGFRPGMPMQGAVAMAIVRRVRDHVAIRGAAIRKRQDVLLRLLGGAQ